MESRVPEEAGQAPSPSQAARQGIARLIIVLLVAFAAGLALVIILGACGIPETRPVLVPERQMEWRA